MAQHETDDVTTNPRDDLGMLKVTKPRDYRDLGQVDIAPLLAVVERMGERLWLFEDSIKENKFEVLGKTQHMVFRFTPGNMDPRESYDNPSWTMWKRILLPIMDAVTDQYDHRDRAYSKVMLARMPAGARIEPHRDGGGSNRTTHKVHVPLKTNSETMFFVDGTKRHLKVGQAYEVNNIVSHGAVNRGKDERIHLIFEHFDRAASPTLPDQAASRHA